MTRKAAKQLVEHLEKIQHIVMRMEYSKDVEGYFPELEQSLEDLRTELAASFNGSLEE